MKLSIMESYVLGLKINKISSRELINKIALWIRGDIVKVVNYINIHGIYIAKKQKNQNFINAINNSEIVFCDGFGIKIIAKILGIQTGPRMTPPDWIDSLFTLANKHNFKCFFIGDEEKVIRKFSKTIAINYPNLIVKGYHHGFFLNDEPLENSIIQNISIKDVDLLLVGMGMPVQENWVEINKHKLNVKVIISVGALYRWYTKTEKRGPKLLTDNGFEWLTRLISQPRKVWKRYVIEVPYVFFLAIYIKLTKKYKINKTISVISK